MIADEVGVYRFERPGEGPPGELMGPEAASAALDRSRAVAEVARNHHSALVRRLTACTGSTEDAKEILQEAYAKLLVLNHSASIRHMVAYLWRISVNLAIDRSRRQALLQRFYSAPPIDESQEFSAEAIAEARERLMIVECAIAELPARCMEAFVLHVQNGMTFAEVGRVMGISDRMAKKHLARAVHYLGSRLDAAEGLSSNPVPTNR